jgi:hypothetical protein
MGLDKGVKSSASPASMERGLFGDPDYTHNIQGDGDHPVDPPHQSEESSSRVGESAGL